MGVGCAEPETFATPSDLVLSLASVGQVGDQLLSRRVVAEFSSAWATELTCTFGDQSLSVAAPLATSATFDLFGLLADEPLACALQAAGGDRDGPLGELEVDGPVLIGASPVTFVTEAAGYDAGWVTFNHTLREVDGPHRAFVVDGQGRPRWVRALDAASVSSDIGVELAWASGEVLVGGGQLTEVTRLAVDGRPVWTSAPSTVGNYHHDAAYDETTSVTTALREAPVLLDGVEYLGFQVVELRADGSEAVAFDAQWAVDARTLAAKVPTDGSDVWHANAMAWVDDAWGRALWVSLKSFNALIRIQEGELTHVLGVDGDVALVGAGGNELAPEAWFYDQHGPDYWTEDDGLHVLVYDNGVGRAGAKASRVVEMVVDLDGRTATPIWVFDGGPADWYTPLWGDVDRVSDAEVLVARGHCQNCLGIDPDERSEIQVVDAGGEDVLWSMRFVDPADAVYRAQVTPHCPWEAVAPCPQ